MTVAAETTGAVEPPVRSSRTFAAAGVLAVLVVAGDLLLWQHRPGLNLFAVFAALAAGVVVLRADAIGVGRKMLLVVIALAGALPLIEAPSPWALLTATGGIAVLAIGLGDPLPKFEAWAGALVRFGTLAPLRLAGDGLRLLAEGGQRRAGGRFRRAALAWFVPLVLATLFVLLFTAANPLVERGFRAIHLDAWLQRVSVERLVLWGGLAIFAWPFLRPRLLHWTQRAPAQERALPAAESLVFGAASIRNGLVLFNILFAMQTAMDLMFLWGGVRLPEGMSHAEYAHRGAYPLIVTAILAGVFVMAAMRRDGPGERSRPVRTLVYVFVAQKVGLVASSLLRLKLYVDEFQLSELRVAAAIWMALVAVGLVLIVARIALGRSNRWLVTCNLLALSLTLWSVAWLDVPAFVASHNVRHSQEVTGHGQPLDIAYMGHLGPAAIPALDELLETARFASAETLAAYAALRDAAAGRVPHAADWRDWSWRGERLGAYLAERPFAVASGRAKQ